MTQSLLFSSTPSRIFANRQHLPGDGHLDRCFRLPLLQSPVFVISCIRRVSSTHPCCLFKMSDLNLLGILAPLKEPGKSARPGVKDRWRRDSTINNITLTNPVPAIPQDRVTRRKLLETRRRQAQVPRPALLMLLFINMSRPFIVSHSSRSSALPRGSLTPLIVLKMMLLQSTASMLSVLLTATMSPSKRMITRTKWKRSQSSLRIPQSQQKVKVQSHCGRPQPHPSPSNLSSQPRMRKTPSPTRPPPSQPSP